MPGLIRDVSLVSGDSFLGVRMNDIDFLNKVRALAFNQLCVLCKSFLTQFVTEGRGLPFSQE